MNKKQVAALLIAFYGFALTAGLVVATLFANNFSGWGDGATVRRVTSPWSAWPCAAYFALLTCGPFARKAATKAYLFASALLLLFVGLASFHGAKDALSLTGVIAVLSVPAWLPVALSAIDLVLDTPRKEKKENSFRFEVRQK